jgi:DNA-binding MarR family transcriptional regulator
MNGLFPNDPHLALAFHVLKQFRLIYGSVKQHFREVERTCGISGSQLWLLQEIRGKPGIGVSELADRLSIHQSTCSILVDKLGSRGLVEKQRSKDDQRRVGLSLTSMATVLLAGAPGPAEGILPSALKTLPDSTLESLHGNLEALIRNLKIRDDRFGDRPLADL